MFVLFYHELNLFFVFWIYLLHSIKYFVVDRHWMISNYYSYYFRLNFANLSKKSKFPQLRDGNSLFRIGYKHFLDHLNSLDTYVIGYIIKALYNPLVQVFSILLFKGKRPTDHAIEYNPK